MNIAVLYNKPTARFSADPTHKAAEEDTELSASEVLTALVSKGAHAIPVPVTEDTISQAVASIKADLVFNLIEWTGVDTKYAMETFDAMNARRLNYTGATKQNYYDTCDKTITKRQCRTHNLPTADWQEFVTGTEPVTVSTYPVLVKVSNEHSSVGISLESIARDADSLKRIVKARVDKFRQPVYAETFLPGREFQVTLIDTAGGVDVLPPAEIVYYKNTDVPLLTYESRWNTAHHDYTNSEVKLAVLDASLAHTLTKISTAAFTELGFRDYARFDIRCDTEGHPYFLELNSNPGLGDDDEYGMTLSYKAVGMTFTDFVWEIVQSALRRATV